MPKVWLTDRWKVLIPALEPLGIDQEAEIERLCTDEIAHWKNERKMSLSSMRVPMTDTRNRIKQIPLTPANRWKNPQANEYEHIARKYMNFSNEEWAFLKAQSMGKVQDDQEDQQLIENPAAIVAKAEALLSSDRWYDLTAGLALVTGRRLTEVLKTARFFPKSLYSVTFDGQLKKRQDVNVLPYEIPTLVKAELVIAAWRRLRGLVDCTNLDNGQVAERYNKDASQAANRHFAGLIPQQSEKDNLTTKAFRAVYAHIAVLLFCPLRVSDRSYASQILGHWQAKDDETKRHFLTTEHYFGYVLVEAGQVDGRRGIRLSEQGIEVLEVFNNQKEEQTMSSKTQISEQAEVTSEQQTLATKPAKSRGTLTTKAGTFDIVIERMHARGFQKHDEIVVDLLEHDSTAHQMYTQLEPLGEQLGQETPLAILTALVKAFQGGIPDVPGMSDLMESIKDEQAPIAYLQALVERDRKFKAGIAARYSSETDYTTYAWSDLDGHKTKDPAAATERYRRAVTAIIEHNQQTSDPLHRWYINAAIVRDLVGGRNDKVQEYLKTRAEEIDQHHKSFNPPLAVKQNNKNMSIKDEYGPDGWPFMR